MPKEIQLTQGQVTTVCDCHAHLVEDYKWRSLKRKDGTFYARRDAPVRERLMGAPKSIYMHAVINNTPPGFDTDHKNTNTLDNQCSNLRTATRSENNMNQGKSPNNTSGYKGVSWNKENRKWQAKIHVNRKTKYLGVFCTPEEAARAYDKAALEIHRDFAITNFKT